MLRAFGPRARRWTSHLPPDLPVIAVDETAVADAYLAAIKARERAEPFFLWICLPHERAMIARSLAPRIHAGRPFDDRRHGFTQLADGSLAIEGGPVRAARVSAIVEALPVLADLVRIADGLFAASRGDVERWKTVFPSKAFVATLAAANVTIPFPERRRAPDSIVVFAPHTTLADQLIIINALEEIRMPVVVIADGGVIYQPPGHPAPADVADALAGAAIVVDANDEEPASALALARLGVPLAVASTSGAAEYLDGVATYDPWDWRSIYDAAVAALGSRPPALHDLAGIAERARATFAAALTPPPADGPLVSVVIPTYCRRERLAGTLRDLFRQTYANLEVIVVNDGGDPVDDVVAAFPRARYLTYERNQGPEHALNVGFAAARGVYATLLPDDDAFYPDHLARMVDAMERTGASVAHGNTIIRFLRDGALTGFAANVFALSLEPSEALYNSSVAGHAFVVRRELAERLGWFDESLPVLGDQEFQTRLSRHVDFAHVDRFTVEWRLSGGANNISTSKRGLVPDAMRQWFARHPTDRAAIAERRDACIAFQQSGSVAIEPVLRVMQPA